MRKVLLLDYDHTLYPPNVATLKAVDARINLYIETYLGFTSAAADSLRLKLWGEYGTTLKGLEVHHGVERHHYCDFIHAIAEADLPPPDPALRAWLERLAHPCYIFTNARRDWAERGLAAMGLASFLPGASPLGARAFEDIFDIDFMDWQGKPHPDAYAKVDRRVRERHGDDVRVIFADDRHDNLVAARAAGWATVWIVPEDGPARNGDPTWEDRTLADGAEFDRVVASLTALDPESLP